ncbi:MAG: hypothetical protein CMD12_06280 [Flavobacteriales bacterium]|nr:hypothetical protein [Flavobacteriales bacterium]
MGDDFLYKGIINLYYNFEIVIFLFLFIIITNSLIKLSFNLTFSNFDLRLNLFSIILILLFCVLGFCIYLYNFVLNFFEIAPSLISYTGNYSVYSFSENFFNLLGFLIVLIGWSLHKIQLTSSRKFLRILIFNVLGILIFTFDWKLLS